MVAGEEVRVSRLSEPVDVVSVALGLRYLGYPVLGSASQPTQRVLPEPSEAVLLVDLRNASSASPPHYAPPQQRRNRNNTARQCSSSDSALLSDAVTVLLPFLLVPQGLSLPASHQPSEASECQSAEVQCCECE